MAASQRSAEFRNQPARHRPQYTKVLADLARVRLAAYSARDKASRSSANLMTMPEMRADAPLEPRDPAIPRFRGFEVVMAD
jgi:hypothetical protein